MTIEARIAALCQQNFDKPFCWLICFEDRPLQGIPPGGNGPHLLVFTSAVKAHDFIKGRQKFYGKETLSILALDSAETLKELSVGTVKDARYAAPPCGVVIDFQYPSGRSNQVLTPAQVKDISTDALTNHIQISSIPPLPGKRKVKFAWNRRSKAIAIGISSVAALLIVFFILRGVFLGMKSGKIKPLAFMNTPTLTPTITPTATATQKPWEVHFLDDFSSNKFGWWLVENEVQEDCGIENRYLESNALVWTIEALDGCIWQQSPELSPVPNFDAFIDVERFPGSPQGDMGLIFNTPDYSHTVYFLIDDIERTFSVFSLQGDWTTLVDWKSSTAIHTNSENRLGIQARGSKYTFIINGEKVASVTISGFSRHVIGVGMGLERSGDILTIRYRNYEVNTYR